MIFLGNGLSIIALLFLGALVASSELYARVEIHERQAMGIQEPGEVD